MGKRGQLFRQEKLFFFSAPVVYYYAMSVFCRYERLEIQERNIIQIYEEKGREHTEKGDAGAVFAERWYG